MLRLLYILSSFAALAFADSISCPSANGQTYTASGGGVYKIDCDTAVSGSTMPDPNGTPESSFDDCLAQCDERKGCTSVTYDSVAQTCTLKQSIKGSSPSNGIWSGSLTEYIGLAPAPYATSDDATSTVTGVMTSFVNAPSIAATVASSIASLTELASSSASALASVAAVADVASVASSQSGVEDRKAPATSSSSSASSTADVPSYTASFSSASASSTNSTSASSSTPAASGGKRGLAYLDAKYTSLFSQAGCKAYWGYNWYQTPYGPDPTLTQSGFPSSLTFIPMMWGLKDDLKKTWSSNADSAVSSGSGSFLAFNEPDQCGGGGTCMNVGDAVTAYTTYLQPYAGKVRLGSPAITNGGDPMGISWLKGFLSSCSGCQIDFTPIHWYNGQNDFEYFKQHIQDVYDANGNRPIWLTEFAVTSSEDEQIAFLKQALPWLDSNPNVERYSYYQLAPASLVSADGSGLSAVGQAYCNS